MVKLIENVNIGQTIIANIFWMIMVFLTVMFFNYSIDIIDSFVDERFKLMSMIFFMFVIIRMIVWIGEPQIILTSRTVEDEAEQ